VTTCQDFYQLRDQRTASYLNQGSIVPAPVQVCWDEGAANSVWGQILLLALANQLARFCRCAGYHGPDAVLRVPSLLGGASLVSALLTTSARIDPCGRWTEGLIPTRGYRIGVGHNCGPCDIYLAADRWVALASRNGITPRRGEFASDVVGAGTAACAGAANAFKAALGLDQRHFEGKFSLWSFGRNELAVQGPSELASVDLGNVLMVGAGAVSASLVYWLTHLPVSAQIDIIDKDSVDLSNTNRGMLFTADDAGWISGTSKAKAKVLAGFLPDARPHERWFDEHSGWESRWDLVLANDRGVRALLQAIRPPLMVHATTSPNWQAQLHRHRPGRDRCLTCRLPERGLLVPSCSTAHLGGGSLGVTKAFDAALPFLSASAGLLIALDLLRLGYDVYQDLAGNLVTLDWFHGTERPTVRQEHCNPGCVAWGNPAVRRNLNEKTRWFKMDAGARN
jgi:hypothetical protein